MYTSKPQLERSGMGFSFMEAFMDHVFVESEVGTGTLVVMKKKIGGGQAQTVKATAGTAPVKQSASGAKAPSAPAANGQTQPKKKNRKRVQERLAAQEAAKNAESGSSKEEK